jgi:hypothetical protein
LGPYYCYNHCLFGPLLYATNTCLFLAPLKGHLFDTGLINQVLDLLEASSKEVPFTVSNCDVRPNNSSGAQYSRVALELTSEGMCGLVPCAGFVGAAPVVLWVFVRCCG